MNFDIVRAWKDEIYRQSLSDDQLNVLPPNPAGELTEDEMMLVYGSGGGGGFPGGGAGGGGIPGGRGSRGFSGGGPGGAGGLGNGGFGGGFSHRPHRGHVSSISIAHSSTSSSASLFDETHLHSLSAALCETNAFSAAQTVAPVTAMFSPVTVLCSNNG